MGFTLKTASFCSCSSGWASHVPAARQRHPSFLPDTRQSQQQCQQNQGLTACVAVVQWVVWEAVFLRRLWNGSGGTGLPSRDRFSSSLTPARLPPSAPAEQPQPWDGQKSGEKAITGVPLPVSPRLTSPAPLRLRAGHHLVHPESVVAPFPAVLVQLADVGQGIQSATKICLPRFGVRFVFSWTVASWSDQVERHLREKPLCLCVFFCKIKLIALHVSPQTFLLGFSYSEDSTGALVCFRSKSRCWTLAATRSSQTTSEAEFSHDMRVAKHDFPLEGKGFLYLYSFSELVFFAYTEITKDERTLWQFYNNTTVNCNRK